MSLSVNFFSETIARSCSEDVERSRMAMGRVERGKHQVEIRAKEEVNFEPNKLYSQNRSSVPLTSGLISLFLQI